MKIITYLLVFIFCVVLFFLFTRNSSTKEPLPITDTIIKDSIKNIADTLVLKKMIEKKEAETIDPAAQISTKKVKADSIVSFAQTLIGTRYKYASTDPRQGFDCSGFITYVFNHYKLQVPRASKDFKNSGREISLTKCKKGDLILFKGTDSTERIIGHMGIIISNDNGIKFIHASSGKAHGVVITELNDYYMGRFVKVIRIFD
jgi:cell wall-associated NlpC family hydrolase